MDCLRHRYTSVPTKANQFLQTSRMRKIKEPPEIAEIVRYFMPDAGDEELKEATVNFRAYLAVLYRIFLRLEAEGRLDEIRDFPENNDKVIESKYKLLAIDRRIKSRRKEDLVSLWIDKFLGVFLRARNAA